MKIRANLAGLSCVLALACSAAQAGPINGGFESNFSDWTVTGDAYLVTANGNTRTRHDYQTDQGWEGADVWFGAAPKDGSTFAVFGSRGNESVGGLTSALWTADHQSLSFWHAGNNSSGVPASIRAYARILDADGAVLASQALTSYNDSVWREFTVDLGALGLQAGDPLRFRFEDGWSWSVIDAVSVSGPMLPSAAASADVPEPATLALAGLGMLMIGGLRRARR